MASLSKTSTLFVFTSPRTLEKTIPEIALLAAKFEWNVWRAFVMLNYANRVDGNFVMDLDGLPLGNAPGGLADLEVEFEDFGLIVEVTMSTGHTQYRMENESVPRHYGKAKAALGKEVYCLFIAPKISEGTLAHYFNLNRMHTKLYGGQTKIIPMTIKKFMDFLQLGASIPFQRPPVLKDWLETQWILNQSIADEEAWLKAIETNITSWYVNR